MVTPAVKLRDREDDDDDDDDEGDATATKNVGEADDADAAVIAGQRLWCFISPYVADGQAKYQTAESHGKERGVISALPLSRCASRGAIYSLDSRGSPRDQYSARQRTRRKGNNIRTSSCRVLRGV